ncbi:hypothetical protein [Chromobacterium subtsugae]|nr:hypothetical protein [Chromobacterium subtsugae]
MSYQTYGEDYHVTPRPDPLPAAAGKADEPRYPDDGVESDGGEL